MRDLSTSFGAARLRLRFVLFSLAAILFASTASAQVVISQVYGGGGNVGATYKNDYIELFNRGSVPVDLTGWSVQYASSTGTSWQKTNLAAILLQPGQYYLVQESAGTGGTVSLPTPDASGTIFMSASAAKIVLLNTQTLIASGVSCPSGPTVVDIVGYGSGTNCVEGSGPTPTLSNTTAALRGGAGCTDTNNNNADFIAGAPTPRNTATALNACTATTSPALTNPTASPSSQVAGYDTLLSVTVVPGANPVSTGLAVSGDLTAIGGSATQAFYDDGSNGDVTAGDRIFSFLATIAPATTTGAKSIALTVTDAESRSGSGSLALTVKTPPTCTPTTTIPDIQGASNTSALVSTSVTFKGVVTYRRTNGLFVQSIAPDGDDATSDGVFVFTSSAPASDAVAGKTVCVTGTVVEYIPSSDPSSPPMTEIGSTPTVTVLLETNAMPAPRVITAAEPLGAITGGVPYMERFEGMRVQIDSLTTVSPNLGNTSEANATGSDTNVFYGVLTGMARPFREPGIDVSDPLPAGAPPNVPVFDSNFERIRVDARSMSAVTVTSGATVTGLVGPVDFAFRTYTVLPESLPTVSGLMAAVKVPAQTANEVTVASFNMERFYDTIADPDTSDAVLTATAFANRLNKASLLIRNYLRSPDVLAVQEVENQATLQAIADKVNNDTIAAGKPSPGYTAHLVEGNDIGGIDVGFLVRSRIAAGAVTQVGKADTFINPATGLPETLHDRPPLVLEASLLRPGTTETFAFTVIVNHLRSLIGVEDADGRVRAKRKAQAEAVASLVQARIDANPEERIVLVGDFNAFQFNDGYVDPVGTIKGTPTPADQVVVASPDLLNPDLRNLGDALGPFGQQYSYILDGNAQTLDHALANENFWRWVSRVAYARVNADFPESYRTSPDRAERLSDHDPSITYLAVGRPRIAGAATGSPVVGTTKAVRLRLSNPGGANAWSAQVNNLTFRTTSGAGVVTLQSCTVAATGLPCVFPLVLGDLAPGNYVDINLVLDVPAGVTRFSISEQGVFTEPGGTILRFSAAQAVTR